MIYFNDIIRLTKPVEPRRITIKLSDMGIKLRNEVLEDVSLEKDEIILMSPSGILTDNPA